MTSNEVFLQPQVISMTPQVVKAEKPGHYLLSSMRPDIVAPGAVPSVRLGDLTLEHVVANDNSRYRGSIHDIKAQEQYPGMYYGILTLSYATLVDKKQAEEKQLSGRSLFTRLFGATQIEQSSTEESAPQKIWERQWVVRSESTCLACDYGTTRQAQEIIEAMKQNTYSQANVLLPTALLQTVYSPLIREFDAFIKQIRNH